MNDINNLPAMPVGNLVRTLTNTYSSVINNGMSVKLLPSVMLWGPPGVGKSQAVRQVAKGIEESTGKRTAVTDVRLLLFNPIDLRGIPTANAEKTLAVWLKPQIFQMDEGEDVINILFLDEISAAPQSVQAAAYQITLDRVIGEHKLPDNCIVIAAGNRLTDKSVAFKMPKALANRLCHIEVEGSSRSWHDWAVKSGINSIVLGFLEYNPTVLMEDNTKSESLAFPTPRSWEMVSNILNSASEDFDEVFPLMAGCIGADIAYKLKAWSEIYSKIPDMEMIFNGSNFEVPTRAEAAFALISRMVFYARVHCNEFEINNSIAYAERLAPEFRSKLFSDYLQIKPLRKILRKNKVYSDWLYRSGRDWEDYDD